jgi:hypothetical protein
MTGRLLVPAIATITLLAAAAASAQFESLVPVAFMTCAADGQAGPVPAPGPVRAVPLVPRSISGRLVYYATEHQGVLAPRGWHCIALYGSSGATLFVTPEPPDANNLLRQDVTGSAVEISRINGGTSGRFEVAKIAARVFPAAKPFVDRVINEGIEPKAEFHFGPYPDDSLTRRGASVVEFVTPAGRDGLGTSGRLARTNLPISGVAMLLTHEDTDVVRLSVRLPPELRDLAPAIVGATEQDQGDPTMVGSR